jgi:hypothetical protein
MAVVSVERKNSLDKRVQSVSTPNRQNRLLLIALESKLS